MPTNPPLDDIPEEAEFLSADRAADRIERKVRRAFLSAMDEAKKEIDLNLLAVATTYLDGSLAESAILRSGFAAKIVSALSESGQKAEKDNSLLGQMVAAGMLLGISTLALNLTEEQLADFLDSASGMVAQEIEQQARWIESNTAKALAVAFLMIRSGPFISEEVSGAIARTFPPEILPRLIGLNSKQIQALIRRGKSAIYAGVPFERVRRQILSDAEVFLRQRAELVARSITERAINVAQQSTFERAVAFGLLDPDAMRQWITRGDGSVCERCLRFHLVLARIDEPFISRGGEVAWVPDVHAFGRCRVRIVRSSL